MSAGHAKTKGPIQKWFDVEEWTKWISGWGISRALFLSTLFVALLAVLALEVPDFGFFSLWWFAGLAPIFLPIVLLRAGWFAWIEYIREEFLASRDPILLEVKLPRDILKSPRAMEAVFNSFGGMGSGEVSFIQRAWLGQVRPWFSFEIASFGGETHFYIWCWGTYKRHIETSIYAQYPEVEIYEVEDYATKFSYTPDRYAAFVTEYTLAQGDSLPIKSYIDWELDKDPKEEFKIDPISYALEVMSSLKPGEQMWVQIMIRIVGKETAHHALNPGSRDWKKEVEDAVEKVRTEASINVGKRDADDHDEAKYGQFPRPTWRMTEQIAAMERHMGKVPFEVGIRGIYIAPAGEVHGPTLNGLRLFFKQFNNSNYLNAINPTRGHNIFDFPWQDFRGMYREAIARWYFDAYQQRSYFYTPYSLPSFVLSSESLASIYHFPSRGVVAPGLERISAKKSEPPSNLPR